MRIVNPVEGQAPFYAGTCKGNTAPKHLERDDVQTRKIKLDKVEATMFNSPKSSQYIYIKVGNNVLWVKDKAIFDVNAKSLTTTKIERKKADTEGTSEAAS